MKLGKETKSNMWELETNRKFKLALLILIVTTALFVIPSVTTAIVDYQITQDFIEQVELIQETEPTYVPTIGLEQRKLGLQLLGAGHFVALVSAIVSAYYVSNVAQKRFIPYQDPGDDINIQVDIDKQPEEPL